MAEDSARVFEAQPQHCRAAGLWHSPAPKPPCCPSCRCCAAHRATAALPAKRHLIGGVRAALAALPVPSLHCPLSGTSAWGSGLRSLRVLSCTVCSVEESADVAVCKGWAELCPPPPADSSGSKIIQPVLAKAAASHQPGALVLHCCVSSISPCSVYFPCSFLSLFRLIAFQLLEEMQKNGMFNFNLGKHLGSSLVSSLLSIRFSQG